MQFTALHRLLGLSPGPLTNEMIDDAVAQGIAETDDLDWKSKLPPTKSLSETDFPKDIAAMANSGGGVIVYGITEQEKKATGRVDTGELTETHEAACTARRLQRLAHLCSDSTSSGSGRMADGASRSSFPAASTVPTSSIGVNISALRSATMPTPCG